MALLSLLTNYIETYSIMIVEWSTVLSLVVNLCCMPQPRHRRDPEVVTNIPVWGEGWVVTRSGNILSGAREVGSPVNPQSAGRTGQPGLFSLLYDT